MKCLRAQFTMCEMGLQAGFPQGCMEAGSSAAVPLLLSLLLMAGYSCSHSGGWWLVTVAPVLCTVTGSHCTAPS